MTTNKSMLGPKLSVERDAVFLLLKQLAIDNETFFATNSSSMYAARLSECCHEISISADLMKDLVKEMHIYAKKCDYDENTPGNGFRSLICICDMAVLQLIAVLRACSENRGNMMFRVSHQCKEAENFAAVLRFLILSFQQVVHALDRFEDGSLFPPLNGDYQQYNILLRSIESLDTSCFYARPLGFQFAPSVTRIFRVIGFILATYSLSWEKKQGPLGSLLSSSKYLLNPEQRAARIIKVIRESDIEFCKGFWNLSELGAMCNFFGTYCAVSEMREIPLCGPIPIETNDGKVYYAKEPHSHTATRPVQYRIISTVVRSKLKPNAPNSLRNSPYLLIHCHGGGYVATSSKSHESYLRDWAKELNCPIVSIDYSLAPENPYPRPMEEVLYAYAFIINNPEKFGWTGERIVMCGDSAGGNLVVCTTLKLIEINAKRLPNGLVPIYTPFLFQYLPSPSRVMSFMDPLLHMGVVIRCAAAYTNVKCDDERTNDTMNGSINNGHKSLYEYVDQVQKSQQFNVKEMFDSPIVSLVNLRTQRKIEETIIHTEQDVNRVNVQAFEGTLIEEAEEVDGDMDVTNQTVQVAKDSSNIYLSANNYDSCLIDYLQLHPLTRNSLHIANEADAKIDITSSLNGEFIGSSTINDDINDDDVFGPITPEKNGVCNNDTVESITSQVLTNSGCKPKPPLAKKKRSLSQSLADTAALAAGHAYDNLSEWFETPSTPIGFNDKQKLSRSATLTPQMAAKMQQEDAVKKDSSFASLLKLDLPRNSFISPMYCTKEQLLALPPIWFVACHMDPLLDDTIMFARKMKAAGGKVQSVDLLDSLPHGFLNFTLVSPDCMEGSKLCISRLREALGIPVSP